MQEKKIERERQKCVYLHSIDLIFLKKYFWCPFSLYNNSKATKISNHGLHWALQKVAFVSQINLTGLVIIKNGLVTFSFGSVI
jgi:hypothetical protein